MSETLFPGPPPPPPDRAFARRTDPRTSHEAAAKVKVTETQKKIGKALALGPATDEELFHRMVRMFPEDSFTPQSVRSRRAELVKSGFIVWTGDYGKTGVGNKSMIWRLA